MFLRFFIFFFCASAFFLIPKNGSAADSNKTQYINAIQMGQSWLMNFKKPSGMFHYYYDPINGIYSEEDNLVRQIGSYQALIETSHFVKDRVQLNYTLFDFEVALEKYKNEANIKGKKILFFKDERNEASVNSTAYYLLALLAKQQQGLHMSKEQRADIHKAAQSLIKMDSKKGGLYYLYFFPAEKNLITSFGTGAALHALESYANYIQDSRISDYTEALHRSYIDANPLDEIEFIDRRLVGYIPHALLYFADVKKMSDAKYQKDIRPIIKKIIDFRAKQEKCQNAGCVSLDSFNDSAVMEGLAAIYPVIQKYEKDSALKEAVESYLNKAAKEILDYQVVSAGDYTHKTYRVHKGEDKTIVGGFCDFPKCSQIRNEMTMHAVSALTHYVESVNSDKKPTLSTLEISKSLQQAAKWLINTQKKDGLFHYEYDRQNKTYLDDDNVVRQVGTFWSVIELYDYYRTPELRSSIEKFRNGIQQKIQTGKVDGQEIAFIKHDKTAKINASALYIIALSRLKQTGINLNETEQENLQKIVAGALKMAIDKGFYYLYYMPKERNRISIYGSGQMLFALSLYQQTFSESLDIKAVSSYLFDQAMKADIPEENFRAYMLWGIYEAQTTGNNERLEAIIEKLINYRKKNEECKSKGCIIEAWDPALLEGILYAYNNLSNQQQTELDDYTFQSLSGIINLQINEASPLENGAYCGVKNCATLRIDITQHNVISLLNALRNNIIY